MFVLQNTYSWKAEEIMDSSCFWTLHWTIPRHSSVFKEENQWKTSASSTYKKRWPPVSFLNISTLTAEPSLRFLCTDFDLSVFDLSASNSVVYRALCVHSSSFPICGAPSENSSRCNILFSMCNSTTSYLQLFVGNLLPSLVWFTSR